MTTRAVILIDVQREYFDGPLAINCVLGTAADAEPRGIAVEVLSDATGAIPLSNSAGSAGS